MKWQGLEQLKANEKKGVSMALVLCVSAFFMAFAVAILYAAGVMTAQSTRRLEEERCYQLARSYAGVLDQELMRYDQKEDPAQRPAVSMRLPISFWMANVIWNIMTIIRTVPGISICRIPPI